MAFHLFYIFRDSWYCLYHKRMDYCVVSYEADQPSFKLTPRSIKQLVKCTIFGKEKGQDNTKGVNSLILERIYPN